MLRGLRHGAGFAGLLTAFTLLAMAVRALVPAGYMLSPAQNGGLVAVTLCSGHGPIEGFIDLDTGVVYEADQAPRNDPARTPSVDGACVFATMAPLAPPEAPASLRVAWRTISAEPALIAEIAPGRGLAAPPPWSTGPPLTA